MKKLVRDTLRSSWFQRAVGFLAAEWLRLVFMTNRFSFEPGGKDALYERVEAQLPAIFAFWHGQHFLTPFIKNKVRRSFSRAAAARNNSCKPPFP